MRKLDALLFQNWLLRTGPNFPGNKPSLPVDNQFPVACPNTQDCFFCGSVHCNEQVSLSIMPTVWLREHNRIARVLGKFNTYRTVPSKRPYPSKRPPSYFGCFCGLGSSPYVTAHHAICGIA